MPYSPFSIDPNSGEESPGHSLLRDFTYTVLLVGISILLRMTLGHHTELNSTFVISMLAIALASIQGGMTCGLSATLALAGFEWVKFRPSQSFFPLSNPLQYLLEGGLLMSLVSGQLHRAQRRARASNAATLDLERKVLEISDEERRRIGHDLHDGLGQHLTGISLLSTSLAHRIERTAPEASLDAEKIAALVTQSIGWTRDLARGLSPVTLEQEGLFAALEELADNARSLLGIECVLQFAGDEPTFEKQRSMHVFRIVQEAVSNSVKHGKAKKVWIDIQVANKMLEAKVKDNGCGLSAKTRANPGLGLLIMNYRARMLGATLGIERITLAQDRITPSSGTIVTVRCPLLTAPSVSEARK